MSSRRPVELLPGPQDHLGHLGAEVPVLGLEGPVGQQGPHDLVGLAATSQARVHQEHEVPPRLAIQLQDLEDLVPLRQGLKINTTLDDPPVPGQAGVQELQVHVLVPVEVDVHDELHPPQGRQVLCHVDRRWRASWRARRASRSCKPPGIR